MLFKDPFFIDVLLYSVKISQSEKITTRENKNEQPACQSAFLPQVDRLAGREKEQEMLPLDDFACSLTAIPGGSN